MAKHLMNGDQNEHVKLHEVSGFASETIGGALNEIHAISKGTRCSRFMFSLSLSPPQNEKVPVAAFEDALTKIEKKLGLEGQPRVIVFHEKHGRRHAHCVWSRIDAKEMKAIDQPFFKNKLKDISKQLYLDHGWQLPKGFIDKSQRNPLNFTRAEWQQAARTNQNPKAIKANLQQCWARSDDKKSFEQALQESGYWLAKGDKRGFVAIDIHGEVYSLTRQLTAKKKEIEKRLGKVDALPSVETVKNEISGKVSKLLKKFMGELDKDHNKELAPLLKTKAAMTLQHRKDRAAQKTYQESRWQKEEALRASKIRKGFKGLWDKLNGSYWKQRKINERETWQAHKRDQAEREELIHKQLEMRQNLQIQFINLLHKKHEQERSTLIRDLSHLKSQDKTKARVATRSKSHGKSQDQGMGFDTPAQDIDFEPEI